MGQYDFYHILNKEKVNLDAEDFAHEYELGDIVYHSEAGCSLICPLAPHEIQEICSKHLTDLDDENERDLNCPYLFCRSFLNPDKFIKK